MSNHNINTTHAAAFRCSGVTVNGISFGFAIAVGTSIIIAIEIQSSF